MTEPEEKKDPVTHADEAQQAPASLDEDHALKQEAAAPTLPQETPYEKITQELASETNIVQHVAAPSETKPEIPDATKEETAAVPRWRKTSCGPKTPRAKKLPPGSFQKKKRKKRDGLLSAVSGFLSFLLVVIVAGAFGVIAVRHKSREPGPLSAEKTIYFPPRSDTPEMIALLQREGVIESPMLMNVALLLEGVRTKLKQGEYLFKARASLHDVIDEMANGRQVMHSLTIPEGLTTDQILQRLRDNDMLAGTIVDKPKEGALLPETYKFPRDYPRTRLMTKMQDDQRKLLEQIWAKRNKDLPLQTPYELLTLASIVEKETGKNEERPRVAAVFINRLRKHMRLQSDPTIIYGLVGGKATLGRGILRSEIEKWTPYNTYAIDGLPPGPIANPGRAALEATANPAATQDLYFVADGTGGHVFAETLEQHARNVQQWRRIEQEQKQKPEEMIDHALPDAAPPVAPKNDKRTQAPIGRLVNLSALIEDFPLGAEMAQDNGATHRLGKYSPQGAAFFLGGYSDPTEPAARDLIRYRRARAYVTADVAQRRNQDQFEPTLLAAQSQPVEANDDETLALGPDMVARESSDGRALAENDPDMGAYPISPEQRADQLSRAARLGLGGETSQQKGLGVKGETNALPQTVTALAAPQQTLRPRAFDASEGTVLDPLRDKSWDLTSAKTVPTGANLH
ncbi:MAG: endolytic transglycosylase MltG [Methylocystis sp.]